MAANVIHHEDPFPGASAQTLARYQPLPVPPPPVIGVDPASAAAEAAFTEWFAEDTAAEAALAAHAQKLHQSNTNTTAAITNEDVDDAQKFRKLELT